MRRHDYFLYRSLRAKCRHGSAAGLAVLLTLLTACSDSVPPRSETEHPGAASGESGAASGETGAASVPGGDEHGDHHENLVVLSPDAAAQAGIRTAPVEEREIAAALRTTGQVGFDENRLAHVSPRISGRVHRVEAQLGERVRAGDTLAEIDSIELGQAKAAFLQAKAKEELARTSFERFRSLFAESIVAEQEVLEAEAELREQSAGLRAAEEMLHLYGLGQSQVTALSYDEREASIYPLRAPIAGTVVERHATLGELVTPERNLFTVADLGHVWIWIDVYERDLAGVHLDDRARARADAFPEEVFIGTVSYLSASVDADTRTVRARLDVANPDGKLRPGMFVEVELVDPHAVVGRPVLSMVVPEDAVVREAGERSVFVAAGEHRYERREVRVGRESDGFAEILAGLRPGEPVVVEGAFLLKSAASRESLGGHEH